uniref:Uncharacterized protein n=1 Tax=Anguilla anguilla TaxID=7936 RepID=A0A0E9VRA2_ANGAN
MVVIGQDFHQEVQLEALWLRLLSLHPAHAV